MYVYVYIGKVKLMICNRFGIRGSLVEDFVLVSLKISLKISWQFLWQSILPHDLPQLLSSEFRQIFVKDFVASTQI